MELAGAPGFEPGNGGIKIRCLTTWLRPILAARRHIARLMPGANRGARALAAVGGRRYKTGSREAGV